MVEPTFPPNPWQCPCCMVVYAPWVKACHCSERRSPVGAAQTFSTFTVDAPTTEPPGSAVPVRLSPGILPSDVTITEETWTLDNLWGFLEDYLDSDRSDGASILKVVRRHNANEWLVDALIEVGGVQAAFKRLSRNDATEEQAGAFLAICTALGVLPPRPELH